MNNPFQADRIRLFLAKNSQPQDQITGTNPAGFIANTDIQFELGFQFPLGELLDAFDFSTVTLAIKPLASPDAAPLLVGIANSSTTGWNSNPVLDNGDDTLPATATYNSSGYLTPGVQVGAQYTWTRSTSDLALYNATGANLLAGQSFTAGSYTLTGLTPGALYLFTLGADTSVNALTNSQGYFVPGGTTITILGVGTNAVTARVWATVAVAGSNLVPSGVAYSGGNWTVSPVLTAAGFYQWIKGGTDDVGVNGTGAPATGFFIATGSDTLNGSGSTAVTAQIYAATAGANLIPVTPYSGTPTSVGATLIPGTGSNLVTGGPSYSGGNYTLTGLTIGTAYYWSPGANDTGAPGLTAAGIFVATGTTAVLTGTGSSLVTATVKVMPSYAAGAYTVTGLTPGATYYWVPGPNDGTAPGLTSSGLFIASGTSVTLGSLTGETTGSVTALIYATTMPYTLNGLSIGQAYYWTKGANDLTCGSLSASGFFTATATSVVLTGNSNATITALVQAITPTVNGPFNAGANVVALMGTASVAVTAGLVGSVGWNETTDQHCVIPFTKTQTDLAAAPGGFTAYIIQVSVTTTTGKQVVIGYGQINVYDNGFATGVPITGNLVPSGASYDGSGNYTLTVPTAGYSYFWQKNAHDLTAPGLTSSGQFWTSTTSVLLTGTPSTTVTAVVYSTNFYPFEQTVALAPGASSYTVSGLNLPWTPITMSASISGPSGGGIIDIYNDRSTLSNNGATWDFGTAIPGAGYYITIKIK